LRLEIHQSVAWAVIAEVRYRASGARTAQRRPNRLTSIQSAARLATAWTTRVNVAASPQFNGPELSTSQMRARLPGIT
jgi:hypothetical protein